MELTPYMEEKLRDVFNLEIEMLQGTREPLPDGRARLTFEIKDQAKGRMVVDLIMMLNDLPSSRVQWLN